MFEITIGTNDNGSEDMIEISGEVDIFTAPDFKNSLYDIIGEGKRDVVLECGQLSYIDSTGLGILLGALKRVRQNERNVYVRNLKDNIRKLFKITGLDKVFVLEEAK